MLQGTLNTDLTNRIQVLQLPVAPGAAPEAKVLGTMDAVIVATARFDPVADALYFTKVDAEICKTSTSCTCGAVERGA